MPPWWGDLSCPDVILNTAKLSTLFQTYKLFRENLRFIAQIHLTRCYFCPLAYAAIPFIGIAQMYVFIYLLFVSVLQVFAVVGVNFSHERKPHATLSRWRESI